MNLSDASDDLNRWREAGVGGWWRGRGSEKEERAGLGMTDGKACYTGTLQRNKCATVDNFSQVILSGGERV